MLGSYENKKAYLGTLFSVELRQDMPVLIVGNFPNWKSICCLIVNEKQLVSNIKPTYLVQ